MGFYGMYGFLWGYMGFYEDIWGSMGYMGAVGMWGSGVEDSIPMSV